MVVKSDSGVWMETSSHSVAYMVAVDCMMALGLDFANDFRTRDKIISAIGDRIDRSLNDVADQDIYRRAMESMAAQFVCPKTTALDMAKTQLGIR